MRRLLIVQPYVPQYRTPLFSYMKEGLREIGFQLEVAAGCPSAEQRLRGDASSEDFVHQLEQRDLSIGKRSIHYKRVGRLLKELRPDLVIVEQAIKNLESWPLLLARRNAKPLVGIWGQGGNYSHSPSRSSQRIKKMMNRQGRWFFAYTDAGASFVVNQGFRPDRVTILNNSTDTAQVRQDLAHISSERLQNLREHYGLVEGKTALFMGGVDPRKGIGFLIEAARQIGSRDPQFQLLVAGEGSDVQLIEDAGATGVPIHYLGRVEGTSKADVLALSDFLLIPEWVGLVATDALAAGRPVVTTDHFSHAPELGYLIDGVHRLTTPHEVDIYSTAVIDLMNEPQRLKQMQESCRKMGLAYSIGAMGDRFIEGISDWASRDL